MSGYLQNGKVHPRKSIASDIQIRYRLLLSPGKDKIRNARSESMDRKVNPLQ